MPGLAPSQDTLESREPKTAHILFVSNLSFASIAQKMLSMSNLHWLNKKISPPSFKQIDSADQLTIAEFFSQEI